VRLGAPTVIPNRTRGLPVVKTRPAGRSAHFLHSPISPPARQVRILQG
jgi:hypothetical protein